MREALERLPDAVRAELDPARPALGILASEWYPASLVHSVLDAVTFGLSEPDRQRLSDDGAEAIMRATLHGLYKTLFSLMATPERYARFGPKLWGAYYDSGRFEIIMPNSTTAVCTIAGWSGHHPFACDLNRSAAGAIYRAMGCESVRVERTSCVSNGDPACRFVSTWRAARQRR